MVCSDEHDATIAVAEPAWDEIMLLPGSPSPEAKVDETRSTSDCGAPR
jgi:hypothetical protein